MSYKIPETLYIVYVVFDMYTIKDISEIIGWSSRQIYDRMNQIDDFMTGFTERGKKNKILVNDTGFKILRRLNDLENDDFAIKEAAKKVGKEMESSFTEGCSQNDPNDKSDELLESYKKQIADLKRQIQEKDKLINWFQELITGRSELKVKLKENDRETSRAIEYPH